jgi:hypothetical protein
MTIRKFYIDELQILLEFRFEAHQYSLFLGPILAIIPPGIYCKGQENARNNCRRLNGYAIPRDVVNIRHAAAFR